MGISTSTMVLNIAENSKMMIPKITMRMIHEMIFRVMLRGVMDFFAHRLRCAPS